MVEDKWLLWKLRHGRGDALRLIYEKYKNDMLALAIALSNDKTVAEDIVHDCFVSFAQSAHSLRLKVGLKSYLLTAVANRVRNMGRDKIKPASDITTVDISGPCGDQPDLSAMSKEDCRRVGCALAALPYQQQEVIILHLQAGLKFREIADVHGLSVNTIQSRYRYGLEKLRSILDGEVEK